MAEDTYKTVPAGLDELLNPSPAPKSDSSSSSSSGDRRPGPIPKAKLNRKLITAIVRRLRILYLDAPKKEDRILNQ